MSHVVLLGDSTFDNESYVPNDPPVVGQLRDILPASWTATLLAVDGASTADVIRQLDDLPSDATHLVVSAGANNTLTEINTLSRRVSMVSEAMALMQDLRTEFRSAYDSMLRAILALEKPTVVCTVYDSIPGLRPAERAALACFNEVILREASAARIPLIDLRVVCDKVEDYSEVSPIEPSAVGGMKIARIIAEVLTRHDFETDRCVIHS